MREYLKINLNDKKIERETFAGERLARAGRYFIAEQLVRPVRLKRTHSDQIIH